MMRKIHKPTSPRGAVLRFTGGALQGVRAPAPRGLGIIGSGGESTLTIPDAGDARLELDTRPWHSVFGPAVRLLSGEASLGGEALKVGRARRVPEGAEIRLGDASFEVEPTVTTWQAALSAAPIAAVAAIGLVMLLFAGGGSLRDAPAAASAAPAPPGVTAEAAAEALRQRLSQFDLTNVTVEASNPDRLVRVSGSLGAAGLRGWDEARIWFDNSFGGAVVLAPALSREPERITLPIAIRSIWTEPRPTLVDHQGRRRHIGDPIGDGWFIMGISATEVVMERDGRRLTFTP